MRRRGVPVSYFRNFVFGVEDSLVSTVGLLSGVVIAGMERKEILAAGLVLIFVEAISMAAGSFLSESASEEYVSKKEQGIVKSLVPASIMFVSYFVSGFVPLAPYLFLLPAQAFLVSIGASLLALCVLGIVGATVSGVSWMKSALRMTFVGGLAILVGVFVGHIVS